MKLQYNGDKSKKRIICKYKQYHHYVIKKKKLTWKLQMIKKYKENVVNLNHWDAPMSNSKETYSLITLNNKNYDKLSKDIS